MLLKPLWPALFSTLLILVLCLTPGDQLPEVGIINVDKAVHAGMFGALTWLYAKGFFAQTAIPFLSSHALINAFWVATSFGGLVETLQAHLDINRSGDWLDFLFDVLGAALISGLMYRFPESPFSFGRIQREADRD